jgi:hypothetical protein
MPGPEAVVPLARPVIGSDGSETSALLDGAYPGYPTQ